MDSVRDWVEACSALTQEQKNEIKERLAFAKSEAESTINALDRAAKSSSEKCRELTTIIENLEVRARNAEARAAAAELKENELRLANEKLTEQVKVLQERSQLRLMEQKDLTGFLDAKNVEVERLRTELRANGESLGRAHDARIKASLEAEAATSREEALKAEVTRLRVRLEASGRQMQELQADMNKQREEMVETVRDRGMKILQLQMALGDKAEELKITQSSLDDFRKLVEDQREKVKDLVEQLHRAQENSVVLENNFKSQLEAQRQLAVLYEENAKSSEARAKALEERGKELDEEFVNANEAHHQEVERLSAEIKEATSAVDERETVIADLKKELDNANKLLEKMKKHGVSDEYLAQLSPAAAAASKLLKPNMSLTQIYSQYVAASEDAERLKTENEVLRSHIEELVNQIQAREPLWKEERERTVEAKNMVQTLSERLSESAKEIQDMRFQLIDARTVSEKLRHDAEVQKITMKDLRSQITTLTVELENVRGHKGVSMDVSGAGESDIVTFKSVEQLQMRNEELLGRLRTVESELETVKKETEEKIAAEMKGLYAEAEKELTDLREARERNIKIMENLRHQRDMYREIAARVTDGELPAPATPSSTPRKSYSVTLSPAASRSPFQQQHASQAAVEQKRELEGKLAAAEAGLAAVKKEYQSFREEHSKNLSLLMQENAKLREEVDKFRQESVTKRIETESGLERLNVAKTNMELYKKQLKGVEEHNKRLNLTVGKLEDTIESMRHELLVTKSRCNEYDSQVRRMNDQLSVAKSDVDRLSLANRLLEDASRGQAAVIADLRALRAELESRDNTEKIELRSTIASLRQEIQALERRASEVASKAEEEANGLREAAAAANAELLRKQEEATKLQETVETLQRTVEEAEAARADAPVGSRLEGVPTGQASAAESALNSRLREYESELATVRVRSMALQRELDNSRNHVNEYKRMASSLEEALQSANVALEAHRKETSERIKGVEERLTRAETARADLERDNQGLCEVRQLLKEQLESSENARKGEVDRLVKDLAAAESRAAQAEAALAAAKKDLVETRLSSDEVAGRLGHETQRRQELEEAAREARRARDEIQSRLGEVERELESARASSAELKSRMERRVQDLEAELSRDKQAREEEKLGYEKQLTGLEIRMTSRRCLQGEDEQQDQIPPANLDESFDLQEASPEQLKKLIAYMKKERDVRAATMRVKEAEIARLQQTLSNATDELNAARSVAAAAASSSGLLNSARSEAAVVKIMSSTEHEAVMNKVHLVSALEDSNRVLRTEKDSLDAKCKESDARAAVLESQLNPKMMKIQELETKLENSEFENTSLKAEVKKWQSRANSMAERTQKVNPQDLEKLVAEKDQLAAERQSLALTVQEKDRELAEKDRVIQEKEKALRDKISATQQRDEATNETRRLREANEKLTAEVNALKASMKEAETREESLKSQIRAVKQLARKYKESSEEKQKDLEAQTAELQKAKESSAPRAEETKEGEAQTEELPPAADPEMEARLQEAVANIARLEITIKEKETLQSRARQMMEAMRTRLKASMEHKDLLTKALQTGDLPVPTLKQEPTLSDADCAALWGLDPEPYISKINELKAERDALQKDVDALKAKGPTAGPAPAAAVAVPPQQSAVATSTTHVVVTKTRVQVQPQVQQPSTSSVAAASRTTPTASIRPLRPDSGGPQPSGAAAGNSQPITGVVLPTIAEAPGASGAAPAAEMEEGSEAHLVSSNLASTSGANIAMISPNFSRSTAAATSTTTTEPSAVPGPSGTSGTSSPVPKTRKRELDTTTTSSSNFGQGPSSTSADETQAKRTRVAVGPFELMPQAAGASGQQSSETPPEVSEGGEDVGDDVVELDDGDEEPVAAGGAEDDVLAADDDGVAADDDDIQEIDAEGEAGEAAAEEGGAADDNDEPVPIDVDDEGDVTEGDGVGGSASAPESVVAAVEDITSGQESSTATQSTIGSTVSSVSTSSAPAEVPTGTSRSSRSIYLPRNDSSTPAKRTRTKKIPILFPTDEPEDPNPILLPLVPAPRGRYPGYFGHFNAQGGYHERERGGYVPWHLLPDRYDRSRYVLRRNLPADGAPAGRLGEEACQPSPPETLSTPWNQQRALKKSHPGRAGPSGRQQGPGGQAGPSGAFSSPPFEEGGDEGIVPSTPTLCPGRTLPDSEIAPSVPLDLPTSSRFVFSRGAPSSSGTSGVSSAASSVSGTSPTSGAAGGSGGAAGGSGASGSGTSSTSQPQALDDTRVEIFVEDSGPSGQSSSAAVADSSGDSSGAPQQEQSAGGPAPAVPQQQPVQPPQQSGQHGVRADSNTSGRRPISWSSGGSNQQPQAVRQPLLPHPPSSIMVPSGPQRGQSPPARGQRARRSSPYIPGSLTRGVRRGGGRGRGSQGYLPGWN